MQHSEEEILQLLDVKTQHTKSSQQYANIVQILFSDPKSLIEKMDKIKTKNSNLKDKSQQFDVESIDQIYKNVSKHKLSAEVAKCYDKIIKDLQQPEALANFVKSRKEMRLFFIMILWEDLFTKNQNKLLMTRLLNLINSCPGYTVVFEQWSKQYLNQHQITLIISHLHQYLEGEFEKIEALAELKEQELPKLWFNIKIVAKFIGLLYRGNCQKPKVPREVFIYPNVNKYFDPINQFKRVYRNHEEFNLIPYSYLFDLKYKNQLLHIESILEQKLNIQKSMQSGISGMINSMLENGGGFSIEGLIYLHFEVNRNNLLDDSMEKLGKVKQNLKSPLRIKFCGEQGADEGGVKNQYFQLITKEIFNPYLDMFLPKHTGRVYWFNGFSFEPPIRFQFVGMLLGLAIYNSVHLNIPFPNVLYKKLLQKSEEEEYNEELLDDLWDIEPQIAKGLKKILSTQEPLDDLELYFTIELESFGQKIVEELVGEGRQIKVSQDNKNQYVQLYADYLINKHTQKQFTAFKKGFLKVVSGKMIEILDPIDLKTIIYGNDVIDFKELEESSTYEGGYSKDTPVVKNFWEILHSLSIDEKKAFLVFSTGSDRVPIEGLKSLEFVIQRHANTAHLPSAHTCFNVLLLPEYESKEQLEKMIHIILKNNQGFGLI